MIRAEIIADSEHPADGGRLTTFRITVPRRGWIHVLTHKTLAKNAGSLRATPTSWLLKSVWADPCLPEQYGANRRGMQSGPSVARWRASVFRALWRMAAAVAIAFAWVGAKLGLHKEVVNYLLEPFIHTTALVTGTDQAFANFFALRNHPEAHPTVRALAETMQALYVRGSPTPLAIGEWHIPFDPGEGSIKTRLKRSVARCARVSVSTFDRPDKPSNELDDLRLYGDLMEAKPPHASPSEHQACAVVSNTAKQAGCLQGVDRVTGWLQFRKTIPNEATLK